MRLPRLAGVSSSADSSSLPQGGAAGRDGAGTAARDGVGEGAGAAGRDGVGEGAGTAARDGVGEGAGVDEGAGAAATLSALLSCGCV